MSWSHIKEKNELLYYLKNLHFTLWDVMCFRYRSKHQTTQRVKDDEKCTETFKVKSKKQQKWDRKMVQKFFYIFTAYSLIAWMFLRCISNNVKYFDWKWFYKKKWTLGTFQIPWSHPLNGKVSPKAITGRTVERDSWREKRNCTSSPYDEGYTRNNIPPASNA